MCALSYPVIACKPALNCEYTLIGEIHLTCEYSIRPVGEGGSRGYTRTPLLTFKQLYTSPGYRFKRSTDCINCSTTSLAAMALSTSPSKHISVAAMHHVGFEEWDMHTCFA